MAAPLTGVPPLDEPDPPTPPEPGDFRCEPPFAGRGDDYPLPGSPPGGGDSSLASDSSSRA